MLGHRRAMAVGLALAGCVAGCLLSIGPLPSAAGDDGGPPDAPSEGVADAGGAPTDSGGDARFCDGLSPTPFFCDDFDEDQSTFAWKPGLDDGGAIGVDDAVSVSAPAGLRSAMVAAKACSYAVWTKTFSKTYPTRATLAFDVRPGRADGGAFTSDVAIMEISIGGPGDQGDCGYYFNVSPTQVSLVIERAADQSYPLSKRWVAGVWTHVELGIDTGNVSVKFDGLPVGGGAQPAACKYGFLNDLDVGMLCVATGVDTEVHVDNVVVTLQ